MWLLVVASILSAHTHTFPQQCYTISSEPWCCWEDDCRACAHHANLGRNCAWFAQNCSSCVPLCCNANATSKPPHNASRSESHKPMHAPRPTAH